MQFKPGNTVQPLREDDMEQVRALQPPDWTDITKPILFYIKSPFCFPIKVLNNKEIIGIGNTILHENTAWLAHIIVHPRYRNKGIGRFITQQLIKTVPAKYNTILLIATALGEPVYRSIGFRACNEYIFYKGETVEYKILPNVKPLTNKYSDAVLALDKKISGEDRKCQLVPHMQSAYIHITKNALDGFYLPDLGEGLIIAENEASGRELMNLRFTTKDTAVFPYENKIALNAAETAEFNFLRTAKRMYFGKNIDFKAEMVYNRIGGYIG